MNVLNIFIFFVGSCLHVTLAIDALCPDPSLISPCTCTPDTITMDMDCADVNTEEQLRDIMNQDFQFKNFRDLSMNQFEHQEISFIDHLSSGIFGNNTFEQMVFGHTDFATISPDVFDKMVDTLDFIHFFYNGRLTSFTYDFSDFTTFNGIRLEHNNQLSEVNLISPTISSFYATYCYQLNASLVTLNFLTANSIDLNGNGLEDIPDLSYSTTLPQVSMLYNDLKILKTGALCHSRDLVDVNLDTNSLTHIEDDSLCVGTDASITLRNNHITSLNQSAWENVAKNAAINGIDIGYSSIDCDCAVEWILTEGYTDKFTSDTRCSSGTAINNLDSSMFTDC